MGCFFKWRRRSPQEAWAQALIIKHFTCVSYGMR
jgi:hypothetical protein